MRPFMLVPLALLALLGASRADDATQHTKICTGTEIKDWCETSSAEFKKWFPLAYEGDYQGQRNVAYCLLTGCSGAVMINPSLACAWRMVILLSGSSRVDETDQGNFRTACGTLDQARLETAKAQADRLRAMIQPVRP